MSAAPASLDTFKCRKTLKIGAKTYEYFALAEAEKNGLSGISSLPISLKVLIENLLRHEDGRSVTDDDVRAVVDWLKERTSTREIAYRPARVLMQDFTGVPAVVDLAAMRDAMKALGGDPSKINPLVPVDLVIDHSVQVDFFGSPDAFKKNIATGKTDAKPEIWKEWDKFTADANAMEREAAELAKVAQSGNMEAISAQVKKLGDACGSCHKPYRKPKEESYKNKP